MILAGVSELRAHTRVPVYVCLDHKESRQVVPGGSAHACGLIREGDTLLTVTERERERERDAFLSVLERKMQPKTKIVLFLQRDSMVLPSNDVFHAMES